MKRTRPPSELLPRIRRTFSCVPRDREVPESDAHASTVLACPPWLAVTVCLADHHAADVPADLLGDAGRIGPAALHRPVAAFVAAAARFPALLLLAVEPAVRAGTGCRRLPCGEPSEGNKSGVQSDLAQRGASARTAWRLGNGLVMARLVVHGRPRQDASLRNDRSVFWHVD